MRVMTNIIYSGVSKSGDDWRVLEFSDTNGSLPMYVIERNQGEHDRRFFIVGRIFTDKAEALRRLSILLQGEEERA